MTRDPDLPRGEEDASDELPGPPVSEDALVFTLGDPEAVRPVVEGYKREKEVIGGLGVALQYVDQHRDEGAEMTPVYPERALEVLDGVEGEGRWRVALPDRRTDRQALSAYHYLQLDSRGEETLSEIARLEAALRSDPRVTSVYRPAIPYARDLSTGVHPAAAPPAGPMAGMQIPQWAIDQCHFPEAWKCLDQAQNADPGPIGVIDKGSDIGHPELADLVTEFPPPGNAVPRPHASRVIAVLAAHRDGVGMDGCCSAKIDLHNISTDAPKVPLAFSLALKAVACKGLRVVNISLELGSDDSLVREQVKECIDQGIIIVAAMGDRGNNVPVYPAKYPGVIAVGATSRGVRRLALSSTGAHIWLSAPGEEILTIRDAATLDDDHNGTSFAAPMVSAAAWLALRVRPYWSREQVKSLLARSVHRTGQFDNRMGHGRLDMSRMLQELTCQP